MAWATNELNYACGREWGLCCIFLLLVDHSALIRESGGHDVADAPCERSLPNMPYGVAYSICEAYHILQLEFCSLHSSESVVFAPAIHILW